MTPLRFVPYHELGELPNVIVDGGPTPSTRLTLSHWPGSPTPVDLLDDLSAQIAFRALGRPELFDGIEAVSNNHFDQDGLASVFALLEPAAASARRSLVIDVARAGDFGTFEQRDAIRIAFALAAFEDPERSPLDPAVLQGGYEEQCGRLYEALLPRFVQLLDEPDSFRPLWEREDAHLGESLDAIERGIVRIDEEPDIDLAVVTVPDDWAERMTTRFTVGRTDAVHPAAINQSTGCLRLLQVRGRQYRLECRYETWVMFRSRRVQPRPDLRVLAARLDELEGGARWRADPPGALTPVLRPDGDSTLAPGEFRSEVEAFLRSAPAAWDPYAAS